MQNIKPSLCVVKFSVMVLDGFSKWPNIENSAFKLVLSYRVVSLLHKSKLEARSGLSPACGQCVSLLPTAIM